MSDFARMGEWEKERVGVRWVVVVEMKEAGVTALGNAQLSASPNP